MAKTMVSARIDDELYDYYKDLEIPLSMIIEAGLIDFARRTDKIEFLNNTFKNGEMKKLDGKKWNEYLRDELEGFNLNDTLEKEILKDERYTIMAISDLKRIREDY